MVEGYFNVNASSLLSDDQKQTITSKLKNRISAGGLFQVRSQVHRSQLSNKAEVVKKMNQLIAQSLKKEKPRISTRPSKASKAKRLDTKKIIARHKQNRQRIRGLD